jgi:hypothetical protein
MIHHLYIIDHGMLIYSHDFVKESSIDPDLLSGFLSAIGSFAQETFKASLQAISVRNGEKLNFLIVDKELMYCAVSNEKDNNRLLENVLRSIAATFTAQFGDVLKTPARSNSTQYLVFDEHLPGIVRHIDKKRSVTTMVEGLLLGAALLAACITGFFLLLPVMESSFFLPPVFLVTCYIAAALFFSTAISGFVAGNPRMGVENGLIFFAILTVALVILYNVNPIVPLIIEILMPFLFIVCLASGWWGGMRCDLAKLYPLPKASKQEI